VSRAERHASLVSSMSEGRANPHSLLLQARFQLALIDTLDFRIQYQAFGKKVAKDLNLMSPGAKQGVGVIMTRYLPEMANYYWATVLAESPVLGSGTRHIVHCDNVKKDRARKPAGVASRVISFATAVNEAPGSAIKGKDPLIVTGLGNGEQWRRGAALSTGGPVVAMNGLFNDQYDLGGPLVNPSSNDPQFEPVYYLKRISKGYVFRAYPNGWQAWLEGPDMSIELLKDWGSTRPSLAEAASLVRGTSLVKYKVRNLYFYLPVHF
jgi:hypothetical protein